MTHDPFSARQVIDTPLGERVVYRLDALEHMGGINSLPYSIKVLLDRSCGITTARSCVTKT